MLTLAFSLIIGAASAQDLQISCQGGVALPDGAFFPSEPAGCRGMPGFVEIRNGTRACLQPLIGGMDASLITVQAQSAYGLVGIGVRTQGGDRFCIPSGSVYYGFVPVSDSVSIGAVGWTAPKMSWQDAPLDPDAPFPIHVMNVVQVNNGVGLSASTRAFTCEMKSRDFISPQVSRDTQTGIPVINYDYTSPFCGW